MIVHTGYARHTITLDDGSVWSWKAKEGYWLSGMDFPDQLLNEEEAERGAYHARRAEPFRYNDRLPLTNAERGGLQQIASTPVEASVTTAQTPPAQTSEEP